MSDLHGQQPSPYLVGPSARGGLPWSRVVARVLLVVVPGQVVGIVLAGLVIPFHVLAAHPGLGWLTYVFVAVVSGLALGLLFRPPRDRLVAHAVVSAVVCAVVLVLLLLLGQARTSGSGGRSFISDVLPGVPLTALLQTALAVLLWVRRLGRSSRA